MINLTNQIFRMKKIVPLLCLLNVVSHPVFSQKASQRLTARFHAADTVLLVSHENIIVFDETTHNQIARPLLLHGRPNTAIIKKQVILTRGGIDSLVAILSQPDTNRKVEWAKCFDPHNAILLIGKNKISYIDCCFDCRNFEASEDLTELKYQHFSVREWADLQTFFTTHGVAPIHLLAHK
jgi:hypothetical protein